MKRKDASKLALAAALALPISATAAFGQESWPPPLPQFEFSRAAQPPPEGDPLDPRILVQGLGILIQSDVNGLGAEAARVDAWRAGKGGLRLVERSGAWSIEDGGGGAQALTPAFGAALRSQNQYFGLTAATQARPITRAELQAAFLTPEAVESVRSIFDRVMAERIEAVGKILLPEIGGEATLARDLRFHFNADSERPTLREMIARRDDPAALARLFDEQPAAMARVDPQGILKRHLGVRARWDAEDKIPKARRDSALHGAVDIVAESAADHYSSNSAAQLQTMLHDEWSGRYAGPWHCHPPDAGPDGWRDSNPPSDADYEAASKAAGREAPKTPEIQEIVIAFMADGFDVYPLLGNENESIFNPAEHFSYRSADWRAHFQGTFDLIKKTRGF